ncbi:hypothetical protein ACFQX8_19990 [Klenkia terrae]|uniref:hypothetical protein n=1 Tax=Klenkia terrae TaxID=1052259 RepID=UPI00361C6067
MHTLGALSGVLADLELMPLALDYQRRAHHTALRLAEDEPGPASLALVGDSASRLAALCAEVGEGLLDDGIADAADPHFTQARTLAVETLAGLPADDPHRPTAEVVLGAALVGLGEHDAAVTALQRVVGQIPAEQDRALLASAELALGRALRRQGNGTAADDHLAHALALSTEHGLPASAGPPCGSCARCTPTWTTPPVPCPTCRPTWPTSWTGSTSGAPAGSSCSAAARACWRPSGPPASCAARPTRTR